MFFQPETFVPNFLHLLLIICPVHPRWIIQSFFITPVCGAPGLVAFGIGTQKVLKKDRK